MELFAYLNDGDDDDEGWEEQKSSRGGKTNLQKYSLSTIADVHRDEAKYNKTFAAYEKNITTPGAGGYVKSVMSANGREVEAYKYFFWKEIEIKNWIETRQPGEFMIITGKGTHTERGHKPMWQTV